MLDLKENAFRIAKFMYDHDLIGSNTSTVATLKEALGMSADAFDAADTYLLESHYSDGTMGGDAGQRRLTATGVDFVTTRTAEAMRKIDEAVVAEPTFSEEPENGHVLFIDVVGYSKLRMNEQLQVLQRLNEAVESVSIIPRAKAADRLIILPTGDGMAVIFFGGVKPHVDAAIELSRAMRTQPDIGLRIGVHSGPVQRVMDINSRANVSGPGINLAQRVMDCGDSGHVLLSQTVADVLLEIGGWEDLLDDLGTTEVKHGKQVHLFNLRGDDFGNADRPSRLSSNQHDAEKSVRAAVEVSEPEDESINVLLTLTDGKGVIIPAERIDSADTLVLTLLPADAQDTSFLGDLRKKPRDFIGVAYNNVGMHARVKSASSTFEHGKDVWRLELQPFEGDYRGGGISEMACGKYSADRIAEMRARRILLNEKPPYYLTTETDLTRRLNTGMLEAFIQGIGTHVKIQGSIIPLLFHAAAGDIPGFLVAARLYAVLLLHVSGVVEHIYKLDMEMKGESELAVRFEARRPRTYANVEPTMITFEGICELTQE